MVRAGPVPTSPRGRPRGSSSSSPGAGSGRPPLVHQCSSTLEWAAWWEQPLLPACPSLHPPASPDVDAPICSLSRLRSFHSPVPKRRSADSPGARGWAGVDTELPTAGSRSWGPWSRRVRTSMCQLPAVCQAPGHPRQTRSTLSPTRSTPGIC